MDAFGVREWDDVGTESCRVGLDRFNVLAF
jgi:hypothetical protein